MMRRSLRPARLLVFSSSEFSIPLQDQYHLQFSKNRGHAHLGRYVPRAVYAALRRFGSNISRTISHVEDNITKHIQEQCNSQ